jgi:hypothetical protein
MRRLLPALCLAAGVLAWLPAAAEIPGNTVRVGVLTDMTGPFADQGGPGSVVAAKMAAEDFAPESKGLKVEILSADHQNKPDIGAGIAAKWVDQDGVDAVVDLPNSGVALAVAGVIECHEFGDDRQGLWADHGAMGQRYLGPGCEHRGGDAQGGRHYVVFHYGRLRAGSCAGGRCDDGAGCGR